MTQVQGSNILDVLKKKMRQTKEEMEKYKEEGEDSQRKLQVEIMRREEVSVNWKTTVIASDKKGAKSTPRNMTGHQLTGRGTGPVKKSRQKVFPSHVVQ